MPACLKALCNDCVTSLILKPAGFLNGGCGGNDLRARPSNACQQILVRKAEMEADNLRMELRNEVAHFIVEGSAVGVRSSTIAFEPQFDIVGIQTSSPPYFASWVARGLLVTEEVHIDWTRCPLAYDFEFPACLLEVQKGTRERTESPGLRDCNDHFRSHRARHRRLN